MDYENMTKKELIAVYISLVGCKPVNCTKEELIIKIRSLSRGFRFDDIKLK